MAPRAGALALACIVLLVEIGGAAAGATSNDFSAQVARPLIDSLSGGAQISGVVVYSAEGNNILGDFQNCGSATDPNLIDACKYIGFVSSCVILGVVVFPILMFFGCCGFCCGRSTCECCCKPCGQPNCGGKHPTREYPLWEKLLVVAILFPIAWIFCLAFSAVGFASLSEGAGDVQLALDGVRGIATAPTDEGAGDVQLALDGVRGIATAPTDVLNKLDKDVATLKTMVSDELQPINDVFAKIGPIKTKVGDIKTSLASLQTSIEEVAAFVEGCKSGTASCSGSNILPNWNRCESGASSPPDGAGIGAELSTPSNGTNPLCKNPSTGARIDCKCCSQCHDRISDVASTLAAMPSNADLDKLDVTLPMDQFDAQVDSAFGGFRQPVKDMQSSIPFTGQDIDDLKASLSAADSIITGVNVALWIPSWIALIGFLVAMLLMKKGSCCWWTCYIIACIWFILVLLPLWGILTIPAALLESFCEILPPPQGTADVFVNVLENSASAGGGGEVDITLIRALFDDCLLPTNGYLWGIVGLNKTFVQDQLKQFDVGKNINVADITANLRVKQYAAPFLDNSAAFEAFSASDASYQGDYCTSAPLGGYSGPPTCSDELSGYQSDLDTRITAMKNAATNVKTELNALDTLSLDLENSLYLAINKTSNSTLRLVDGMWEFGSCTMLASKYAGVHGPFCSIAHIFGSVWAASFVCGILWTMMFVIVCVAKKHFRQILVPFKDEDTSGGKQVVHAAQVANSSGVVGMAIPAAVALPAEPYGAPPPPPERDSHAPSKNE